MFKKIRYFSVAVTDLEILRVVIDTNTKSIIRGHKIRSS